MCTANAYFGIRGGGWAITHPFNAALTAYQSGKGWRVGSAGTSPREEKEVVDMPDASRSTRRGPFRFALSSGGRPHLIEDVLSVGTLICGLVAFATGFMPGMHVLASWAGAVGFVGGLYSQYISATTRERALNIVGIVASFVGVAFGIHHGGFLP